VGKQTPLERVEVGSRALAQGGEKWVTLFDTPHFPEKDAQIGLFSVRFLPMSGESEGGAAYRVQGCWSRSGFNGSRLAGSPVITVINDGGAVFDPVGEAALATEQVQDQAGLATNRKCDRGPHVA
jgi:hypothetical protein